MAMADKITTIKLRQKTKDELAKLGAKGDSYEVIVRRLLQHYKFKKAGK
jgi:hypothetical protein